jgi:hypothetical protein
VVANTRAWIAALLLVLLAAPALSALDSGMRPAGCPGCPGPTGDGDARPCQSLAVMSCCEQGVTLPPSFAPSAGGTPAPALAAVPIPLPNPWRVSLGARYRPAPELAALVSALRLSVVLQT